MENIKVFTIKTSYSEEEYICKNIDQFLSDICFCDEYETISTRKMTKEEKERYKAALDNNLHMLICSGYALGFYNSLNDAIKENEYM